MRYAVIDAPLNCLVRL